MSLRAVIRLISGRAGSLGCGPLALAALALAGCGETSRPFAFLEPARDISVTAPNPVDERLAQAAGDAADALSTLAAIEQARTPNAAIGRVENAPAALQRAVTVRWNGPIMPITKRLAERAGYGFRVLGTDPPVPVVVNLNARERSVIDLLRDIGLQAGTRADIAVDASNQRVEVRYRESENEPVSLAP